MWRKLNRSKDPTIGSPTLIETTFDQDYLNTIPEASTIRAGKHNGDLPSLPALPFKVIEPLAPRSRVSTSNRIHSGNLAQDFNTLRKPSRASDPTTSSSSEVSPLSSPRASADDKFRSSPDISPIDAHPPSCPDLSKTYPMAAATHLPIRKVPAVAHSVSRSLPASSSLAPASKDVDRGQYTPSVSVSTDERLALSSNRKKKLLSGFQEQGPSQRSRGKGHSSEPDILDHPIHRESWKGASGRTALVEPVRNMPRSKKDPRSAARGRGGREASNNTAGALASSTNSETSAGFPTSTTSGNTLQANGVQQPRIPIAPLQVKGHPKLKTSIMTAENLSGPFNPRFSGATTSSYENGRTETDEGSSDYGQTDPTPIIAHELNGSLGLQNHRIPAADEREPPSHFSWTTYATTVSPPPKTPEKIPSSRFSWTTYSTSVHESPRPTPRSDGGSNVPPVPYLPNANAMRQREPTSHTVDLHTSRQQNIGSQPTSDSLHKRPSSLQIASSNPTLGRKSPTVSEALIADKSKSLPRCPPEVEAKDRIAALQARRDELDRRRSNIKQILSELKTIIQPTNMAYDFATRQEGKKTVRSLEDEQSEIDFQDYQISMILRRAEKKRDQENIYGNSTSLWVKRFTS